MLLSSGRSHKLCLPLSKRAGIIYQLLFVETQIVFITASKGENYYQLLSTGGTNGVYLHPKRGELLSVIQLGNEFTQGDREMWVGTNNMAMSGLAVKITQ